MTVYLFSFAFFLGSIPFGLLVARIFKVKNLDQRGSGNIGATNVSRVIGFWPAGFVTFLLDVGKGSLAVFLVTSLGVQFLTLLFGGVVEFTSLDITPSLQWATGLLVMLGHCYSPWLNFKGGKGVATAFGVILILSPIAALAGVIGFVLAFIHKRIVSLASISGLLVAAIACLIWNPIGVHLWIGVAMLFLVLIRHEVNIDALLENTEKPFY